MHDAVAPVLGALIALAWHVTSRVYTPKPPKLAPYLTGEAPDDPATSSDTSTPDDDPERRD